MPAMVTLSETSIATGSRAKACSKIPARVFSAIQPSPRLARVTPNWLADRTRAIFEVARSAIRASRSPERTIASSRVRRERTRENSAATKNPLRSTSARMANSREITPEKYHNTPGGGLAPGPGESTHLHVPHGDSGIEAHHHGGHSHFQHASTQSLRIALVLTAGLLVLEGVGGILSNSLALLADAGHMFTDVGALALSLFVAWFTLQPGTPRKSYGYLRWEILAAFINGATLLLISAWILFEAVMRVRHPEPVRGGLMLAVAVAGLIVNVIAARVLHPASHANMNVRGAYLHVLGDLLASVGTVVAAVLIRYTGWLVADPLVSFLTAALIVRGSWQLVRESVGGHSSRVDAGPYRSRGGARHSSRRFPASSPSTISTCGR